MSPQTKSDPVICHCLQVTQSMVLDSITLLGASNAQEVKEACGAGAGCMACRRRIQCLIQARTERAPLPRD